MENELTVRGNLPYPGNRHMEDIPEQQEGQENLAQKPKTKEEDKKKEAKPQERLAESQVLLKKAWERVLREKQDRGEKIKPEELEMVRRAILKGEGPTFIGGGSGDGKFENFPADKYEKTPLKDIAKLLRESGSNGRVPDEFKAFAAQQAHEMLNNRAIDEETHNRFIQDFNASEMGTVSPEDAIRQEQGDNASTANESDQEKFKREREEKYQRKKENSTTPQSLQQVVFNIIYDEGEDRWGEIGKYPLLITKEDAARGLGKEGAINKANFLRWTRERMLYHHFNNSRDYQLNLLQSVGIDNEFGSKIPIVKMTENRQQYFKDVVSGEVLDDLADQCLTEVWLFGKSRNNDLVYQLYMGSDSKLPEFLTSVHQNEEFTAKDGLERIMTMSNEYKEDEKDTKIGDAVRKAYEIYYYASDYDKLKELLGEDTDLFKRETFEDAYRVIYKMKAGDPNFPPEAVERLNKLFDGGKAKPAVFIKEMNPFNEQNKAKEKIELMREAIRITLAKMYGLDNGLNEDPKKFERIVNGVKRDDPSQRDLVRTNLVYAEWWAWTMSRWTGAAARNDTDAIGFDAFTKTTKFRDYRVRQSSASRAGQFGNEYDLPVFKSLTRDFFNGVQVEKKLGESKNTTPFEVFEMMDRVEKEGLNEVDEARKKKEIAKRLRFEQFTQVAYAANHVNRAYEIFHSTLGAEEMKLEEIVKWDPLRGIILDRGKFEEQIKEKFLKPMRYAFSTYGHLDFGKITRMQTSKGDEKKGIPPQYDDVTVAETFFGPEVTRDIKKNMKKHWLGEIAKKENEGKDLSDRDKELKSMLKKRDLLEGEEKSLWSEYLSTTGRPLLWKRAAMARMALQIKSHRQFSNNYSHFSGAMVNTLYDALATIRQVELEEKSGETTMNFSERFLTKEDIEWIRKMSGTTKGKMALTDNVPLAAAGLGKGLWDGASDFVKFVFK